MAKSYSKYKDLVVQREQKFKKYVEEVSEETNRIIREHFNSMFDDIRDTLSDFSSAEAFNFMMMLKKDGDVSHQVIKLVEGIWFVKEMESMFGKDKDEE